MIKFLNYKNNSRKKANVKIIINYGYIMFAIGRCSSVGRARDC